MWHHFWDGVVDRNGQNNKEIIKDWRHSRLLWWNNQQHFAGDKLEDKNVPNELVDLAKLSRKNAENIIWFH